jgi:LDH2 family malate/lactate/ureidoglycolate dehydrogenase
MQTVRQAEMTRPVIDAENEPHWIRFPLNQLSAFVESVFLQLGLTSTDAIAATESLVVADLYGIDSHGIARLPFHAH